MRSAAAYRSGLWLKELGDQIARLMAALTRAEQVVAQLVLPIALGTGVMGEDKQAGTLLPVQAPTMVGLAWAKPLPSAAPQSPKREGIESPRRETWEHKNSVQGVCKVTETPTLCNVLDDRVGVTWPWSALLWPKH